MLLSVKAAIWIIVLAVIAIILVLFQIWRRKRGIFKLERDNTGLWRYHSETQFTKQLAFEKRLHKKKRSKKKEGEEDQRPVAVINFSGDIRARHHRSFARLVDEVEVNREELSEVVVVVTSGGGMVSQYGHLFSQMERLRSLGPKITVCIDVVAASGGYLMSIPANRIVAAPFAAVGSVGVVAFVPNIRKLLQDWDINPRTFTAGKYKRTVSLTDDAAPEEIARFQAQLEAIHSLFLKVLKKYRPGAKFEEIETGDHWTAQESVDLALGLVDELGTSQEYLLRKNRSHDLIFFLERKGFLEESLSIIGGEIGEKVKAAINGFPPV